VTPREVVERAYSVFARHGLPPVMSYCELCERPSDEKRLRAPLRVLSTFDVWSYVMNAIHHMGDERDFLHFAPRVLADVLLGEADDSDIGLYLGRFAYAGWRDWPDEERRVVRDALDVLWETCLSESPPMRTEDVLAGVANVLGAGPELAALLDAWAARTDPPAVAARAALAEPLDGGWWDDEDAHAQVLAWLRGQQ
jgi:hypothetical protein